MHSVTHIWLWSTAAAILAWAVIALKEHRSPGIALLALLWSFGTVPSVVILSVSQHWSVITSILLFVLGAAPMILTTLSWYKQAERAARNTPEIVTSAGTARTDPSEPAATEKAIAGHDVENTVSSPADAALNHAVAAWSPEAENRP